eukprot:3478640-Rhodomonas_salina.1
MQAGAEQYSCCTSGTYFVSFGTTGLSTSCRLDENHDIVKPAPLSLQILLASRVGETSARVIEVLITTVVTEQVHCETAVTPRERKRCCLCSTDNFTDGRLDTWYARVPRNSTGSVAQTRKASGLSEADRDHGGGLRRPLLVRIGPPNGLEDWSACRECRGGQGEDLRRVHAEA